MLSEVPAAMTYRMVFLMQLIIRTKRHSKKTTSFLGIALIVFAAMTLGFELYFRGGGRKYDGLLRQYRKEHEGE